MSSFGRSQIRINWGHRPKVDEHELSKIVSFEEAVDASDAIRRGLS